jgi:hypothetical protein
MPARDLPMLLATFPTLERSADPSPPREVSTAIKTTPASRTTSSMPFAKVSPPLRAPRESISWRPGS